MSEEIPGYYFDNEAADKACEFFSKFLKLSTGEWASMPFELQAWQREYVSNLCGWKAADGSRRYRESFLMVGKKNGKSQLCAALAILFLILDQEPSAQVLLIANSKDQAGVMFRDCCDMIRMSPALSRLLTIKAHVKQIIYSKTNSFIRVLPNEATNLHGIRPHVCIYDEIAQSKDRTSYDVIKQSFAGRRQPLMISITHAGLVGNSIGNELYAYAKNVKQGIISNPRFYPVIYEADAKDDPFLEATWIKANPSYGVTLKPEEFRAMAEEAKEVPSKLNNFLCWRLNVWVQQVDRWIPLHLWDLGNQPINRASLKGRECYIGIDISGTYDTTAVVAIFPPTATDNNYYILPHIFLPKESALERDKSDNIGYQTWERQGYMYLTPGGYIDYKVIFAKIQELAEEFRIKEIAIDPQWNAAAIYTDLVEEGFKVFAFTQNARNYNPACKELEGLMKSGRLQHGGHPVLRWQANNVSLYRNTYDEVRPYKPEGRNKIDAIAALLMGLSRAMIGATAKDVRSVYEDRGLLAF